MTKLRQVRVIVTGLVQGVFFRASTEEAAIERGLTGWVRNNPGGTVEASFIGQSKDIDSILKWCRRGPTSARVDKIDITEEPLTENNLTDFTIKY